RVCTRTRVEPYAVVPPGDRAERGLDLLSVRQVPVTAAQTLRRLIVHTHERLITHASLAGIGNLEIVGRSGDRGQVRHRIPSQNGETRRIQPIGRNLAQDSTVIEAGL